MNKSILPAVAATLFFLACETNPQPKSVAIDTTNPEWIEKLSTVDELLQAHDIIDKKHRANHDVIFDKIDSLENGPGSPIHVRDSLGKVALEGKSDAHKFWYLFSQHGIYNDSMRRVVEASCSEFEALNTFNAKYYGPDSLMKKWVKEISFKDEFDAEWQRYNQERKRLTAAAKRIYASHGCQ